MSTPNDHGFVTTSTARTEATEAAVKAATVVNAESEHEDASDEIVEESATSKNVESDDDLDDSNESDDSDDAQSEEQKPKKNSLKKRFSKLTQKAKTAEERAQKAEAMLAQLQADKAGNKNQQEEKAHANQQQESVEGKPDPNNFDTHAEYLEALYDWKDAQKEKKNKAATEQAQAEEASLNVQKAYDAKAREFEKTNPDFQEVIDEVVHLVKSPIFLEAILTSDFGPQIAYELAQNPDEVTRLQSVSPTTLYKEIGKLEDRFSKGLTEKKEVKPSSAPRPISPVGSGSTSVVKALNDPDISFAEYEKQRLKQINKK